MRTYLDVSEISPRRWVKKLLWLGVACLVGGQLVSLYLVPLALVPFNSGRVNDLQYVLWFVTDAAQRFLVPIGAALFAASFVVRALVPAGAAELKE